MNKKIWNIYMEKAIFDKVEKGENLNSAFDELKSHMLAESEWISDSYIRESFRKKIEEQLSDISDVEALNTALQNIRKWGEVEGNLILEGVRPIGK